MRNYILCMGLVLSGLILHAQDAKADLLKINAYYKGKALSTDMRLLIFPSHTSKITADAFTAKYLIDQSGSRYYYQFGENEMVQTESFSLLVDHSNKMMMIQPAINPPVPELAATIDSLLKRSATVDYQSQGVKARYSFTFNHGPYPRIDLVFNRNTLMVDRLIHYYHQGAYHGIKGITQADAVRSELVYDNTQFELEQGATKKYLTEARFIRLDGGRYKALPAFSSYRLFDFINLD